MTQLCQCKHVCPNAAVTKSYPKGQQLCRPCDNFYIRLPSNTIHGPKEKEES